MAKTGKMSECAVPGCARATHARGLCQMHYDRLRKREPGLSTGAPRAARERPRTPRPTLGGLSGRASASIPRQRSGIQVRAPSQAVCSVPGCGAPHHAKGYCKSHYSRIRRRRTAAARGAGGQVCEIAGCSSPISEGKRCAEHLKQPTGGVRHMTKPERLAEIRHRHERMRREIERIKQTFEKERAEDG